MSSKIINAILSAWQASGLEAAQFMVEVRKAIVEADSGNLEAVQARVALTSEDRGVLRRLGMDERVARMPETANFSEWKRHKAQAGGGR